MDMNTDYRSMGNGEILKAIDEAPSWDSVKKEVYEYLCEQVGLDYDDYDDPDKLYDDLDEKIRF